MGLVYKTDPYAADVSLLLLLDATLTDTSPSPKTVTAFGNAAISALQSRNGGKSCKFDGTGDYLRVGYAVDLLLGSADFTIEASVYFTTLPAGEFPTLCAQWDSTQNKRSWVLDYEVTQQQFVFYWSLNGIASSFIAVAYTAVINTWYDVAVERIGDVLSLYVNGVYIGGGAITGSIYNSTLPPTIGTYTNNGTPYNNGEVFGYIDEVRWTMGVGRYSANYTSGFYEWQADIPTATVTPQLFAPTTNPYFLSVPALTVTPQLFAPITSPQFYHVPALTVTPQTFAPSLAAQVTPPVLNVTPTLFTPYLISHLTVGNFVTVSPVLYDPSVIDYHLWGTQDAPLPTAASADETMEMSATGTTSALIPLSVAQADPRYVGSGSTTITIPSSEGITEMEITLTGVV